MVSHLFHYLPLKLSGLVILNSEDFFSHRLDTIKPPFSWRSVVTTPRLGLPCKCRISGLVNLMQVDVIIFYADIKGISSFNILKIKCLNHGRIFSIVFKSTPFHSEVLRAVKCNMQSKAIAQRGWQKRVSNQKNKIIKVQSTLHEQSLWVIYNDKFYFHKLKVTDFRV